MEDGQNSAPWNAKTITAASGQCSVKVAVFCFLCVSGELDLEKAHKSMQRNQDFRLKHAQDKSGCSCRWSVLLWEWWAAPAPQLQMYEKCLEKNMICRLISAAGV